MIYESNPIIAQMKEALDSKDYIREYYIDTCSFGKYVIKDLHGLEYGTYANQILAEKAKKELECQK